MSTQKISRGHPLMALLAVLGGWVGGRVATWEAPLPPLLQTASAAIAPSVSGGQSLPTGLAYADDAPPAPAPPGYLPYPGAMLMPMPVRGPNYYPEPGMRRGSFDPAGGWSQGRAGVTNLPRLRDEFDRPGASFIPPPRFFAPEVAGAAPLPPGTPASPPRARRWSMDAWALVRRDGAGGLSSAGALPASYGASQAGGVLRYRLSLRDPRRPTLYLRSTATIGQLRETAAALGFSARPLARLPVIAAVEGRVTEYAGQRRVQGAAMAVTELPPFPLPAGLRGESYVQAGYVAGRFATPFVDGQFRADRALLNLRGIDLRLGAGIWGGAQKGATRLDAGPSATIAVPLPRNAAMRVAVDWRFRLMGNAVPDSGPALTVSTGF